MKEPAAPAAAGAAEPVTSPVDDDQARRSWPSALCRCVAPAAAAPSCWRQRGPYWRARAGWRAPAREREREPGARLRHADPPTTPVPTRAQVEVRAGKAVDGQQLELRPRDHGQGRRGLLARRLFVIISQTAASGSAASQKDHQARNRKIEMAFSARGAENAISILPR